MNPIRLVPRSINLHFTLCGYPKPYLYSSYTKYEIISLPILCADSLAISKSHKLKKGNAASWRCQALVWSDIIWINVAITVQQRRSQMVSDENRTWSHHESVSTPARRVKMHWANRWVKMLFNNLSETYCPVPAPSQRMEDIPKGVVMQFKQWLKHLEANNPGAG